MAAADLAAWAFSWSSNTHNRPIQAARAVAAVDYLAGELSSNPRWIGVSPFVTMQMLQARTEVRNVIGIAPGARSQVVVDSLARYAAALQGGAPPAQAEQNLANPSFTLGAPMTVAKLENLPFMSVTNVATQRAASALGNGGGGSGSDDRAP